MPDARPARFPLVVALVAVLLPALILAVAAWRFGRPIADTLSDRAAELDQQLAEASPQVVIVGNSTVGAGIDQDALSQALGAPVFKAHENATTAATWYLVLKNRVFAQGLQPKLVIVGSFPDAMLRVGPPGAMERDAILAHATGHEPDLWRLTFGREAQARWRMDSDRRKRALRSQMLTWTRDHAGAVVGTPDVEDSLEAVFGGEDATDEDLRSRVIPVVDVRERDQPFSTGPVQVDDSYVQRILELSAEHDARVVFVRFPLRPGVQLDASTADDLRRLIATLNDAGAGWIDLSSMDLQVKHFKDRLHLNTVGQELFTARLAQELKRLRALDATPMRKAWLVEVAPLQRTGQPPQPGPLQVEPRKKDPCVLRARLPAGSRLGSLARLGFSGMSDIVPLQVREDGVPLTLNRRAPDGCDGSWRVGWKLDIGPTARDDGQPTTARTYTLDWRPDLQVEDDRHRVWTWLLPGTTLVTSLSGDAPPGDDPVQLLAQVLRLEADAPLPTIRVGDVDASPVDTHDARVRYALTLADRRLDGLPLAMSLPADASPVLVEGVRLVSGDEESWVIGSRVQVRPGSTSYLARAGYPVRYQTPPPDVFQKKPAVGDDGRVVIRAWDLAAVDGQRTGKLVRKGGWTPVQLLLDGQPVPEEPVLCRTLADAGPGAWCHAFLDVQVNAPQGVDPSRYSLRLDPDRGSTAQRYLYPGDVADLPSPKGERASTKAGARRFFIKALPMTVKEEPGQGSLHVTVATKKQTYLDATIPVKDLSQERLVLPLDRPVEPLTVPTITLASTKDASFLLMFEVGLDEGPPELRDQAVDDEDEGDSGAADGGGDDADGDGGEDEDGDADEADSD